MGEEMCNNTATLNLSGGPRTEDPPANPAPSQNQHKEIIWKRGPFLDATLVQKGVGISPCLPMADLQVVMVCANGLDHPTCVSCPPQFPPLPIYVPKPKSRAFLGESLGTPPPKKKSFSEHTQRVCFLRVL